jgi:hypothetical protein
MRSACRVRCISIGTGCASSPAFQRRPRAAIPGGRQLDLGRAQRVAAVSGKVPAATCSSASPRSRRRGARVSHRADASPAAHVDSGVERLHALLQTHADRARRTTLTDSDRIRSPRERRQSQRDSASSAPQERIRWSEQSSRTPPAGLPGGAYAVQARQLIQFRPAACMRAQVRDRRRP